VLQGGAEGGGGWRAALTRRAQVILDCSEENQAFYRKCGFVRKEVQMALYF